MQPKRRLLDIECGVSAGLQILLRSRPPSLTYKGIVCEPNVSSVDSMVCKSSAQGSGHVVSVEEERMARLAKVLLLIERNLGCSTGLLIGHWWLCALVACE